MTTETTLLVEERLRRLFQHLGIDRAHVAGRTSRHHLSRDGRLAHAPRSDDCRSAEHRTSCLKAAGDHWRPRTDGGERASGHGAAREILCRHSPRLFPPWMVRLGSGPSGRDQFRPSSIPGPGSITASSRRRASRRERGRDHSGCWHIRERPEARVYRPRHVDPVQPSRCSDCLDWRGDQ